MSQIKAVFTPHPEWPSIYPNQRWYVLGECRISAGLDPDGSFHLSISHRSRYPTWGEIKQARYALCPPDIHMAMILPPKSEYVNVHENCFHLHQIFPEERTKGR